MYKENKDEFKKEGKKLIKMVLISDLHLEYDYTIGAKVKCDRPACCKSDSGMANSTEEAAGKWGGYYCDLKSETLDTMLAYVKDTVKPDIVLWGGDSVGHSIDTYTE